MKKKFINEDFKQFITCVLGGIIYAVGFQVFAQSSGLFIGNLTGISQIISEFVSTIFNIKIDMTGAILLFINIPLFILSYSVINKKFFFKTVVTSIISSIVIQILPKMHIPGVTDILTLAILGGAVCGFGAGLSLQSGGSGGGIDIVGVYLSLKYKGFSVGKVSIIISLLVYIYALFAYTPYVLIYSLIFTMVYSFVIDNIHYQNVKTNILIITKNREMPQILVKGIRRGFTYWDARGAYSNEPSIVIASTVSKYELIRLRRQVRELDSNAFIIENGNVNVTGNYETHLF